MAKTKEVIYLQPGDTMTVFTDDRDIKIIVVGKSRRRLAKIKRYFTGR